MVELAEKSYREMVAMGKELGIEGCHEMKKKVLLEKLLTMGATDGGDVKPPTGDTLPESAEVKKGRYLFPRSVPCPRCGAMDTVAYSTKGRVQYRRCRRPVCRRNFTVRGEKQ